MTIRRRSALGAIAAGLTAALALSAPAQAADITWRMQSNLNAGSPGFEAVKVNFVDRLEKMSGGRMKIELFPVGALFPIKEGLEAVGGGIVEAGMMTGGYFTGKMGPIAALESGVPGAERTPTERYAFFYRKGFIDIAREAYAPHNVYYLGPQLSTPWDIVSNKKIASIEDFQGLKIRSFGIGAKWFESMGASPVFLGGSEVYTALSTGVVDAVRWGSPSQNIKLGLQEVGKYYIQPSPMPSPNNNILINMDAWNALPADLQEMLDMCARMSSLDYLATATAEDALALKAFAAAGVEVVTIPDAEWAKMEANVRGLWAAYAEEGDLAKRAVELLQDYLTNDLGR